MNAAGLTHVKALLDSEKRGSLPWIIAEQVWELAQAPLAELLDYLLAVVVSNPPRSREYEIAVEIWQLATTEDEAVAA